MQLCAAWQRVAVRAEPATARHCDLTHNSSDDNTPLRHRRATLALFHRARIAHSHSLDYTLVAGRPFRLRPSIPTRIGLPRTTIARAAIVRCYSWILLIDLPFIRSTTPLLLRTKPARAPSICHSAFLTSPRCTPPLVTANLDYDDPSIHLVPRIERLLDTSTDLLGQTHTYTHSRRVALQTHVKLHTIT